MSDLNERDAKLVQYLNEAYGKEKELETALRGAHRDDDEGAVQETAQTAPQRDQGARQSSSSAGSRNSAAAATRSRRVVAKATAAAKGPLHAVRGSGEQEKMLKNAKTEYFNEHEEISTYLAIEIFATKVGDKETAKLARDIRREEERMAKFLEGQIKSLSGAVALGGGSRRPAPPGQSRSGESDAKAKAPAKPKPPASESRAKAKAARESRKPRKKPKAARPNRKRRQSSTSQQSRSANRPATGRAPNRSSELGGSGAVDLDRLQLVGRLEAEDAAVEVELGFEAADLGLRAAEAVLPRPRRRGRRGGRRSRVSAATIVSAWLGGTTSSSRPWKRITGARSRSTKWIGERSR